MIIQHSVVLGFILSCVMMTSVKFGVIGDWGYLSDPDQAQDTFKAIKDEFQKESFEFLITVGDNIYNDGLSSKDDKQLEEAMDLIRTHDSLKDLPLYPVLGNHDCHIDAYAQVQINQEQGWLMESDYYTKGWDIDGNGSTDLSILFLNGCLLVCKNQMEEHCPKMPISQDTAAIDAHYQWLEEQLAGMQDSRWRAVNLHWPASAVSKDQEYPVVLCYLLPLFQKYNVDVWFAGHTHTAQYLTIPYDRHYDSCQEDVREMLEKDDRDCKHDTEVIETEERISEWNKGDMIHEIICGATGLDSLGKVCKKAEPFADLHYADNTHNSFARVTVTTEQFYVKYINSKGDTMYEVTINK